MLRLLMQAGLAFATFNVGQKVMQLKRSAIFYGIAGVVALLGLGALVAALVIALEPRLGWAGSAAAVGVGLLVSAGLIGWLGSWTPKPKRPTPIIERVRAEVGAAGAAMASARRTSARRVNRAVDEAVVSDAESPLRAPAPPGARRKRALNMVLIATIAGVVLGRRL